jgi:hypothetical protein
VKFKAKIDWWMQLIIVSFLALNIWALFGLFTGEVGSIILAIIFTPTNVFLMVPMWLNTYYLFDESELLVKCGLGKGTRISYSQITSVSKTRNPISSPAPSLDRLEVRYKSKSGGFSDTVIISPKDKTGFIEQLQINNPDVEVFDNPIPLSKSSRATLVVAGAITALSLVGVGILFAVGLREPVVTIHGDNIQINAMYGTSVNHSNIANISLLDQSMREVGAGSRTNGFNGGAWRGHFTAGLLFVTPDSSPTIRIERINGGNIFISFRNNERTMTLYDELTTLGIFQ